MTQQEFTLAMAQAVRDLSDAFTEQKRLTLDFHKKVNEILQRAEEADTALGTSNTEELSTPSAIEKELDKNYSPEKIIEECLNQIKDLDPVENASQIAYFEKMINDRTAAAQEDDEAARDAYAQ